MDKQPQSSAPPGYCIFETAIGLCGVAWSERGFVRFQLPDASGHSPERRLRTFIGDAAPAQPVAMVASLITQIRGYLTGEQTDFSAVPVDYGDIDDFRRRIYETARAVAWGQTVTYGILAERAGFPGAAQEVGQAMARNRVPIVIPCHRVLASGHKIGGFSAPGGILTKERLLALERVYLDGPQLRLPGILAAKVDGSAV